MSSPIIQGPADPGLSNFTVTNNHGAVIPHVSLQLIFWGKNWPQQNPGPSADQITAAVRTLLSGPYMSGLLQYGIGLGSLRGTSFVPYDPPNPFSQNDWHSLMWSLIDDGVFPFPDEPGGRNLYLFVTPPGTTYDQTVNGKPIGGEHGDPWQLDPPADVDFAWAGFVINPGTSNVQQNLNVITTSLSHEIAEACTDPEGDHDSAWKVNGLQPGLDEICDICTSLVQYVGGVAVQGYWSNFDNACIIPIAFSLRRFMLMKGLNPGKGLRGIPPPVTSVRTFIIAG
jgi:hypothetical protein